MSRSRVVLDTDVASAEYKGKRLPILTKITGRTPFISFVTFGEMKQWAEIRDWAPRNRTELGDWLDGMPRIHSTDTVATLWGELMAAACKRGRPRPQNDTWIAAVCITHGIPLATLNLKDFEDFETYHGLELVRA